MALVKEPRWSPSSKPYALDLASAKLVNGDSWQVNAVWAGRKRGLTTVTVGTIYLFSHGDDTSTLAKAIACADMRYGGDWHFQWNGESLLVEPTHALTPSEAQKQALVMEEWLQAFPEVPEGYDGWYYRR